MPDLRPLLAPDSVAIIGAAADDSLRGRLTKQLVEHAYPGCVYPVTRSQKEVLGHQAYATVAEIPEAADLAVILVPAAHVVSTIEQCGARGIKAAVVDGRLYDDKAVAVLATLPSREVLLAQVLSTFIAPMTQFLAAIDATLRLPAVMADVLEREKSKAS